MEKVPDTPEGIILESPLEGMNQYFSDEFCRNMKKSPTAVGTNRTPRGYAYSKSSP